MWKIRKRKTATNKIAEKKTVSETECELIVWIPRAVGLRPIVVQPKAVFVAFEVEHVWIAVGIGTCGVPSLPPSV